MSRYLKGAPWVPSVRCIGACLACLLLLVACGIPEATPVGTVTARTAPAGSIAPPPRPSRSTPTLAAARSPGAASPPAVANPALLATLRAAQSLTIVDSWWVYGPIQRVTMRFVLHRVADGFSGIGDYRATSYYGPTSATTRQITIPLAAITTFSELLADAPLRAGPYTPKVTASDYSPDVSIELTTPTGTVSFQSQSQGATHVP